MKITSVQSLATGAEQLKTEFVNLCEDDELTNESGVVLLDSAESEEKSGDEQGQGETPASPDAESPESPCALYSDLDNIACDDRNAEAVVIPDQRIEDEKTTEKESPSSPEVITETTAPASPDESDVMEIDTSSVNPSFLSPAGSCLGMKVRFEANNCDDSNSVSFSLDSKGMNEGAEDKEDESLKKGFASQRVFGENIEKDPPIFVPLYNCDVETVLGEPKKKPSKDKDEDVIVIESPKITCFNCMGNHTLKDCPKRLNHSLISQRRRQFNQNKQKDVRYHEESNDSKYEHFKPGVISHPLRSAMGLDRNKLPGYIWNMRKYGYPPGWFQHAVDASSGLKFYGVDTTVRQVDSNANAEMAKRLQANLPEYPGFTTPVPVGFREDGEWFGAPFNDMYTTKAIGRRWSAENSTARQPQNWSGTIYGAQTNTTRTQSNVQTVSNAKLKSSGNWYDNLHQRSPPSTSQRFRQSMSSDMSAVEQMYQRVVVGSRYANSQMPARPFGMSPLDVPCNYRETEELERLEALRKKRLEEQTKPKELPIQKHPSPPSSPSLLSPDNLSNIYTNQVQNDTENDGDVLILESPKEQTPIAQTFNNVAGRSRPQKRKVEEEEDNDIICLSSDEDDDEKPSNQPTMVPNPLYKRPKLTDPEADFSVVAGSIKSTPTATVASCTVVAGSSKSSPTATVTSSSVVAGSSISPPTATVTCEGNQTEPSANNLAINKTSDVGQQQLLYILAKHSDRTEHLTFGDLPPIENFAKGMPELPFQEEATEFSGRLRKVIDLIKKTRDTQGKPKNDNDDDDDVQIIN